MRKIDAQFVEKGGKLLMLIDPSQISSTTHAEEILRDLIAQWVQERRTRGLTNYEALPTTED
ncbi:MAG: hypothetical protein HYV01_25990 [Deltaproteobacteria bacterium]|nr:hypothetical protein [Deltaproteobacteria bacterium]